MTTSMNRIERLEARVDALEQALAEIASLAAHSRHEPQRRLSRVQQLARSVLWSDQEQEL
jgi:uncharacterized protein with PhoU and TrkA domain